jgi:hypothetical protein
VPDVTTDASREELHKLLDHVPAAGVPEARKFLQSLVDPVDLALLNAPPDDEPETSEERAAVEAALADPAADVSFSQIRRGA